MSADINSDGQILRLGLDVGSTTVKVVVLDRDDSILFSRYTRHNSEVYATATKLLAEVDGAFPGVRWRIGAAGSGSISLAQRLGISFVQEVLASSLSIRRLLPDAHVAIELGGEDAKLTFFKGGLDQRMNETCAGGTGAFIDQMAAFIRTDAKGLDDLAGKHTTIYPIASRCGVFAKTDILPLINDGCAREDIAASIMQAVVNQTVSGLARGRKIEGNVVFLGGPLTFLKSLRDLFASTLKLAPENVIFPAHAELFVAIGAAMHVEKDSQTHLLGDLLKNLSVDMGSEVKHSLPPLFADEAARSAFIKRHKGKAVERVPLEEEATGSAWLGFDSGSTTIKAALIDEKGRLLYSSYDNNKGDPLRAAIAILKEIYDRKRPDLFIQAAAVTGYGSALLTAALRADVDEVETVAHLTAARFFEPAVSFVLDIGGQDIKCMSVKNTAIDKIQLNEACSAGCGSFIENFANSLDMSLDEFVDISLKAKQPVDLGTRCTVFMNSKVKQAQKEGAQVGDIAAGLCYSVVRNACYKVMKVSNVEELGGHVVVQGGSFINDGLLRALELELEKDVTRPDIAGLMGAFGAALIARERGCAKMPSRLLGRQEVDAFTVKTNTVRCQKCSNHCLLTVSTFADKRRFISGNRCERGGLAPEQHNLPNLYRYKNERLFDYYKPLEKSEARRGTLGIPRALNIWENYPLWFTLFTHLGYRVELSCPSSKDLFFKGYETIPSQTVCYPAKLAHGHVLDLADKGVDAIFYPCIPFEQREFKSQQNTYNCPVVIGYPELLAKNITTLKERDIPLIHDFLPLSRDVLAKRMSSIPAFSKIPFNELEEAVRKGFDEMDAFKEDVRKAGAEALKALEAENRFGVVLTGHPYHVDPEVHHGIAELITSCGMGVLTEDSVAHYTPDPGALRVVDQWTYHSRLYRAGTFAAENDNLAILQLVSFGCGLDAVTSDQLEEIVVRKGKLYAQIKIDEGANLGPARIRIRSLLAALKERRHKKAEAASYDAYANAPVFTKEMQDTHTILIPQLSPLHFQFIESIFQAEGLKVKQLPKVSREAVDLGLRYVNNDACYPAIMVVGQLLHAVQSGEFDIGKVALLISETGGGCRATNYKAFLRKALVDSGLGHIPILSFMVNQTNEKTAESFSFPARVLRRAIMAGYYGDTLMRLLHRVRPYEKEAGSADKLAEVWAEKGKGAIVSGNILKFDLTLISMIFAFDKLELVTEERKPRVGLVGEILIKYHPDANNNAARIVEQEGGEAVVPDIMDFVLYCCYDKIFNYKHLAGSWKNYALALVSIASLEFCRYAMRFGLRLSKRFSPPTKFKELRKKARGLISLGHQTGEGWLLAAEMIKLLESGVSNILCMQPFGCLPNHIVGKGIMKELKLRFPNANILAVDYDAGASEVNQINRIKLMMSSAE